MFEPSVHVSSESTDEHEHPTVLTAHTKVEPWCLRPFFFIFLFIWFFTPHQQSFSLFMKKQVFMGWTSTTLGLMCLAQGHNTVTPVRLKHAAPQSRVKHSTTEPLRSHLVVTDCTHKSRAMKARPNFFLYAPSTIFQFIHVGTGLPGLNQY